MKSLFLLITVIGAVMLAGCKNQTENGNSTTVVIMDSKVPTMYQNPDTLEFIKQSVLKNINLNPDSIAEIKLYFGAEGSRKSMLHDLKCEINKANYMNELLSKQDIIYFNSNEELGKYCYDLNSLCEVIISNQQTILEILNEDYGKFNFYYVIKLKNDKTWEEPGIITGNRCSNCAQNLWDLNKMNR